MESLVTPPILFAHRGGKAHAPENTVEAFTTALRLGATGIESDVWLTADGVPVLSHGGAVRNGRLGRAKPIAVSPRSELAALPALEDLYAECGTGFELSLDVKDPRAAGPTVAVATAAGAATRLWLCHADPDVVAGWRPLHPDIRLINSTRMRRIREGTERRAATLAEAGIDGINLHTTDWSAGHVSMFHRFGRLALGWDAQFERVLLDLLGMGIDAVYSDHVDRMVDALRHHLQ